MKKVLVVYYSQSGQLKDILTNITQPLEQDAGISVTYYNIQMKKSFPFPWDETSFFDAFPESRLQIPSEIIAPPEAVLSQKYDLVILGYQVWYLSPSIPFNSFLKSEYAKQLLNNTPVITVIGCRNMWAMAQEKVKALLNDLDCKLVGNIVLVDKNPNHISVITIVEWMFSGEKKKYLGIFPKPGVSDEDIVDSVKFGKVILQHLHQSSFSELQSQLVTIGAVVIHWFHIKMEQTGNKTFVIWANVIQKKTKSRKIWLKAFKKYLLFAIWVVSPIVYILQLLLYPINYNKIKKEAQYFKGV